VPAARKAPITSQSENPFAIASLALGAAPIPALVLDAQQNVVIWNDSARELFGYGAAEIGTWKAFLECAFPTADDRAAIDARLRMALGRSREGHCAASGGDVEVKCKNGRTAHVEVTVLDLGSYSLVYLHDLTEHNRAVEALRESEERLVAAFSAFPEAVTLVSSKTGRYVLVNEGFCRITGHTKATTIGLTSAELNLWADDADRQAVDHLLRTQGSVENYEARFRRRDGSFLTGMLSGRAILAGAEPYFIHITRDVTHERELEERIHQAQRLESVGRLAGGVAHDFNNLLTCIIGNLEQVLEGLPEDSPIRADLEATMGASERAAAATRQLLAFGRRQVMTPEILSLNGIVEKSSKLLGRLLGEDIEIRMTLAPNLVQVRADALQLEQIILNLAVNARDAMPNGGKLTLETCNVELSDEYAAQHVGVKAGPHAQLTVTDNGCGMTQDIQSHVFEPFFTTKGVGKGSGLGLATVYGIVTQSGGQITLYSEPNVGTCFRIYFPEDCSAPEPRAPVSSILPPTIGNETVLVVEDDPQVRSLLRRVLSKVGYHVILADHGRCAIELWQSSPEPIHLVVTDVVMPHMSGRELVDRLRATQPQLKVLYMSGFTDDALGHHGVLDPGTPFLPKPFTADQLKKKVRSVLDG
jgi:two-component system, cell cycle sensor histidine kinase and response regulator CckA